MAALKGLGGAQGLAKKLATSLHEGLDPSTVDAHAEAYGHNKFKETPPKSVSCTSKGPGQGCAYMGMW